MASPGQTSLLREAETDALVTLGRRYAGVAGSIVHVLQPIVQRRGDPRAIAAAKTIETLSDDLAHEVFRAILESLAGRVADPAARDRQTRQSVEVARLLIDDSRRAWSVLMEPGRAAADGVPAQLVAWLDALDAGLAARFPYMPA